MGNATIAVGAPGRLSLRRKLGFAVGDFSFNLYWQAIGLFLLFFYTDVLGIAPGWAGATFLLASVWDGINDPVVGWLADRTRTRRGRYRPFLLFGAVPLAICFFLAFSAPPLAGATLVIYALVTQIALRTAYGFLAIPYSSLSARLTRDADDRTSLTGYRMQFAALGGIAVTFLMPALIRRFGADNPALGYEGAALVIGVLAAAIFFVCYANTAEPEADSAPSPASASRPVADALAFLASVYRSGPLMRLLLCNAVAAASVSLINRNLLYFFKYGLHDVALAALALPLLAIVNIVATPVWVRVIGATSKRTAWLLGNTVTAAGCLWFWLVPAQDPAWAMVPLVVSAAGIAAIGICFWSMLPDIVEFNEWRFGRRDEAKIFGFASLAQKLSLGVAAAAAGGLLDTIGLVANAEQTPETLAGLRFVMGVIPIGGLALSVWIIRRYPIDSAFHRRILAELAERPQLMP